MPSTVYLVSGANRGIGLGIVTSLALRDDVIVFAGTRNPHDATDLQTLVKKYPGKVHVVKLTSCNKAENEAAVAEIKSIAGRLDVVIANAGISKHYGPSLELPADQMRDHFDINVVGTLVLFQATYPLLKTSTPSPKFIPITSSAGSITSGPLVPIGMLPYGSSKAAANYLARKLHFEHEGLICFPLNPGPVGTDMVTFALAHDEKLVMKEVPFMTVEQSVQKLLPVIDNGTREKDGGTFLDFDGSKLEW